MTMSLFDEGTRAEIARRIESLDADSPRQWGTMTLAQACAHCRVPLRIAAGELDAKRPLIGRLLGPLARGAIRSDKPFGKGLPTGPEFRVRDERDLDVERSALVADVERFGAAGPDGVDGVVHPFFGAITPGEWDRLMWKHLDHHLRQFGA